MASGSEPITRYLIERVPTGCSAPRAFNVRTGRWTLVSDIASGLPTRRAAEIYAEENGFVVGRDVNITEHQWG